jgi:hypothetical protein
MSESHCPLCYTPLEAREVAPCYDCGHDAEELLHLAERRHTYDEVETLGARVVLCDFCQSDFSSYDPTYFGLPPRTMIGRPHMTFVRRLDAPHSAVDKYCPECRHRLAFLRFVQQARDVAAHDVR